MKHLSITDFLDLVGSRRGHFLLESGHHGRLWLELDTLFVNPRRIAPIVSGLVEALRPHRVDAVCGPLLGGAFLAQLVARELEVEFCFTEAEAPSVGSALYQARYHLPVALAARVSGKRLALVDDVMSAGSALRATYESLVAQEAQCVAAGAMLVLGSTGAGFFERAGIPVEAVVRHDYDLWEPAACPLCAAGVPLEDPKVRV